MNCFFPSVLFICQIKAGAQISPASFGNGVFKIGLRCSPGRGEVDLQSQAVGAEDTMSEWYALGRRFALVCF